MDGGLAPPWRVFASYSRRAGLRASRLSSAPDASLFATLARTQVEAKAKTRSSWTESGLVVI